MSKNILKNTASQDDILSESASTSQTYSVTEKKIIFENADLKAQRSETKSILKNKGSDDDDDNDDGASRRSSVKKLHFDESVIEIKKAYADPVDAEILRKKLERLQQQQLLNRNAEVDRPNPATDMETLNRVTDQFAQTMISVSPERVNTTPQETFEEHRKRFYKNEYIRMNEE